MNHFEGRERLQNLKMVNWFNLDGPTILIKFKTRGKEIQFSCSAVVYFETRKLNPAADQSLSFWPVLDCVFGLEGHLVNLIHHQISGDLIMNYKND